jgi:hypothetical protein
MFFLSVLERFVSHLNRVWSELSCDTLVENQQILSSGHEEAPVHSSPGHWRPAPDGEDQPPASITPGSDTGKSVIVSLIVRCS